MNQSKKQWKKMCACLFSAVMVCSVLFVYLPSRAVSRQDEAIISAADEAAAGSSETDGEAAKAKENAGDEAAKEQEAETGEEHMAVPVNGSDEKELTDNSQEIRFQGRAQITNSKKITSILLEDELHPAFRYKSLRVWNDKGEDITNDGKVSVDGQLIQYLLYGEKAAAYVGRYIEWEIAVHYIEGSDLSDLKDGKIPNRMRLYVNDEESESNEVHVKPVALADSIRKAVRNEKTDDALEYALKTNAEEILFTGHIQINNRNKINNIVLEDNLHGSLRYKGMSVHDENGKDISDQGEIEKDGQKVRFVFHKEAAAALVGKTFTWKVTAHYIEGSDLSGLKDHKVPNTMQLFVNGEKETSNTVYVIPVPLPDQMHKAVLDGDGNETDYFEMTDNEAPIIFKGTAQIGNTIQPESIELRDELHPAFAFEKLQVYDSKGTDYTKKGEIHSEGQEIRFVLTGEAAAALTGQLLHWEVTVTYREGTDLSNLEGNKIPNRMQLIVNEKETESEEVHVKPEPLPDEIIKKIIGENDSEIDSLVLSDNDQDIVFRGSVQVNNAAQIKSIILQDILHPAFKYAGMAVYDADGKEITDQGEIKTEGQVIQFIFAEKYAAKLVASQLYWEVSVNYIEGSDLSDLKNGAIPNKMQLIVNEKETESDEVLVTPIPMDNSITKSIIDDNGNKVTSLLLEHNEEVVTFSGQAAVPNDKALSEVMLRDYVDHAFVVARDSVRVQLENGEDITANGTVELDQENMLAFTVAEQSAGQLAGQNLIWEFDVQYAEDVDFSEEIVTFNTMELHTNDEMTESNEVQVTAQSIAPVAEKADPPLTGRTDMPEGKGQMSGGGLVKTGDAAATAMAAGLAAGALLFLILQLSARRARKRR